MQFVYIPCSSLQLCLFLSTLLYFITWPYFTLDSPYHFCLANRAWWLTIESLDSQCLQPYTFKLLYYARYRIVQESLSLTKLDNKDDVRHFLKYKLTNLSNFSTFDRAISYTVLGYICLGNISNCKHHNLSLPANFDLSMSCCLISWTSSLSFIFVWYHLPGLLLDL